MRPSRSHAARAPTISWRRSRRRVGRGRRERRELVRARPGRDGRRPLKDNGAPSSGAGFIARWDLDKTYLRTEFDTLGDLVRTALERPDQKRAVPGAAALLHELGRTGARIHILSGSPRQMRARLEEKLRIDRVRWDELTLKPNLQNLVRLRFRALRDQLGYKLPLLMQARARDERRISEGAAPAEVLVGDDAEADAFVYSLYADICAGLVDGTYLRRILRAGRVYADQRRVCLRVQPELSRGDTVQRILIHLDRQTPPSRFEGYGPRLVPFYNYLQAAFVLCEDARLPADAVLRIASTMMLRHRFEPDALARSYLDLMRRGHAHGASLAALQAALSQSSPPSTGAAGQRLEEMVRRIETHVKAPSSEVTRKAAPPDYVALAMRHQSGRNRKRFQGFI